MSDAGISTGSVEANPSDMSPDMYYRNQPCFKIDRKQLRDFTKQKKIPEKVKKYNDIYDGDVYMRYGKHLTFNVRLVV